MAKFGIKEITPLNLLERDPVMNGFVNGLGKTHGIDDYLSHIFSPFLLEVVPRDVQALFEIARGAMAYGYFFYPLFTLAFEQLFRVAEAAVVHKCTAVGVPKSTRNFKGRIKWLADEGIIPRGDVELWDAIRDLRNTASHPIRKMATPPNIAIKTLELVASKINSLFNSKAMEAETK